MAYNDPIWRLMTNSKNAMKYFLFLTLFLLVGCQSVRNYPLIKIPVAGNEPNQLQYLIFHYTALNDIDSINVLSAGNVSIHYLIPTTALMGKEAKLSAIEMVDENKVAWHAGKSRWRDQSGLNQSSIGIEIVNFGFYSRLLGRHWVNFEDQQIALLIELTKDIIQRYNIPPENILGHSDIAPQRKLDPGKLFPWQQLAMQGIGAWPEQNRVDQYLAGRSTDASLSSVIRLQQALASYGYDIPQNNQLDKPTQRVIRAFQMHFRPTDISGIPDAETEAIALALVEQYVY